MVRLAFVHLSGPRRGAFESFPGPVVQIGTAAGAEVRLDGGEGVAPLHAQVLLEGGRPRLLPRAPLRVNGEPATERELRDGDLLEVGPAELRFGLVEEGVPSSPRRRRVAGLAAVLGVVALAAAAGIAARTLRERDDQQRSVQSAQGVRIAELQRALDALGSRTASREEVARRAGELERSMAQVESSVLAKLGSEVERSVGRHPDIAAAVEAARRIEAGDRAVGEIVRRYGPGVCFIQGAYGFTKAVGGEVRFLRESSGGSPSEGGKRPLTLDGSGRVFRIDYTGTGFLADSSGLVLTSRHIAEPWWKSDAAAPLLESGYEPHLLLLRAFFPGSPTPLEFSLDRVLLSSDADLALLALPAGSPLPEPLPLASDDAAAIGRRVVLLGYPSGLSALLAKSEEEFVERVALEESVDPVKLLDELAGVGLVRPLPAQGHVADILPGKLLYDAATAVGASGGPVLDLDGRVVAVNYGLLKSFRGANFGVPVRHARALLDAARSR